MKTRKLEIAGPSPLALTNLASAQSMSGKYREAIESARSALKLDRGFAPAHLILGGLLARDARTRGEAIVHLERAAEEYESARRILAKIK